MYINRQRKKRKVVIFFFFNDTATTEIYTLSLHDALPISCEYTYPVAIAVHSKWIGMEYPMICFNGGRPESDGTYSEHQKNDMISVIIHEVGHNFFPMIINSDEIGRAHV